MKIKITVEMCFDSDVSDLAIKDERWEDRLMICRKWIEESGQHMSEEIACITKIDSI